jgi:plasmid stability protein
MDQIHLRLEEEDSKQIQKKASELGVSTNAFLRQIIKNYLRNTGRKNQSDSLKADRAMVKVLADGLGRMLKASPQDTEKLSQILLKKFDQEVQ